jgi:hypothetical protein
MDLLLDGVFVLGGALLWGALVLLVRGFQTLEKPQGGRS